MWCNHPIDAWSIMITFHVAIMLLIMLYDVYARVLQIIQLIINIILTPSLLTLQMGRVYCVHSIR